MIWINRGGPETVIDSTELKALLTDLFDRLGTRKRVLAVPPDITRLQSRAGDITRLAYDYYGDNFSSVLPALGTHAPMTPGEIQKMFPGVPAGLFREHDWRSDPVVVGTVPGEFIHGISGGAVDFPIPLEVNRRLIDGGHDLILSIGQVVPHEVVGMANYNKNIFIGTGGAEGINLSHFLGAAYGMEKIMGRADSPVRRVLNYGTENFIADLPLVYILTVIGMDRAGRRVLRGLFAGDDEECFKAASELSFKVNFSLLEERPEKIVVYLNPEECRSTWLGNKAIYRTRMVIADGGELIILAPGLMEFGEDKEIDRLIHKYGYGGRETILDAVLNGGAETDDLRSNLSAAAHLIHGSSDGRFSVTYCPGYLSREEIEGAGYRYAEPEEMMARYNPQELSDGWNFMPDGERIFFISKPALGLWAHPDRFIN